MEEHNGVTDDPTNMGFLVIMGIGLLAIAGCVIYMMVKNARQKKLREEFAQTYGVELPKRAVMKKITPGPNTLVLAYPYISGSRTTYSGGNSGSPWTSTSYVYGGAGGQSVRPIYSSGYSGASFSTGTASTSDVEAHPLSEITIDGWSVGISNPFDAYRTALALRSMDHEIRPCMEESEKASQLEHDGKTNAGLDVDRKDVTLTPDDIMARIDTRFRSSMSAPYRSLMDYESGEGLLS